jgi:uncharacterized protein (TIGR02452 family)
MAQPITTPIFYQHCSDIFTELGRIKAEIKQLGGIGSGENLLNLATRLQNLQSLYTGTNPGAVAEDDLLYAAQILSVLGTELQLTEAKLNKAATRTLTPPKKSVPLPVENRNAVSFHVGPCNPVIHHIDTTMDRMLADIKELLRANQFGEAMAIFEQFPPQVQAEIYGEHWKVCGKPTKESKEDHLRKMAHDDFGKVSFLDEAKRCQVPNAKRIETLNQYLPQLLAKLAKAQKLVQTWSEIGQSPEGKKASFDALVKNELLPLFYGRKFEWKAPVPAGDSFEAYLAAYAKKYPCLTPFCLQLCPSLELERIPFHLKSSQIVNPRLDQLDDRGRSSYRVKIIAETVATQRAGHYLNNKGEKITLNIQPAIQALLPTNRLKQRQAVNKGCQTKLFLVKKDCLTVAQDCAERGLNPLVLDAASGNAFGGGHREGTAGQEERICRASTLCFAVDSTYGKQPEDFYPLNSQAQDFGLYAPYITVFRGEEVEGYPYLEKPFEIAVAVMAAYCFNRGERQPNSHGLFLENNHLPQTQAKGTEAKLRNVLLMAQEKGHKSVVLMPFGCGAFSNPAKDISKIMIGLIVKEFTNTFEELYVSVVEDPNHLREPNPRGNYIEFQETLQNPEFAELLKINGTTVFCS